MTHIIEADSLTRTYNGARGLDGFSLRVPEGALFGLVGPNGAGKSTLIKILATVLRPTAGSARISGLDVATNRSKVRSIVGYMPDQPGVYQDMRLREFLRFFAAAFKLEHSRREQAVKQALVFSGLESRAEAFVEELSFGMKQRLVLARTLLHSPRVLLLDEPATGLDPLARIELREKLKALNSSGVTILVSSHILTDLEDICTHVALLSDGKNVVDPQGNSVLALQQAGERIEVYSLQVVGDSAAAEAVIRTIPNVNLAARQGQILRIEFTGGPATASQVLSALMNAEVQVAAFQPVLGLEERYRQVFSPRSL